MGVIGHFTKEQPQREAGWGACTDPGVWVPFSWEGGALTPGSPFLPKPEWVPEGVDKVSVGEGSRPTVVSVSLAPSEEASSGRR